MPGSRWRRTWGAQPEPRHAGDQREYLTDTVTALKLFPRTLLPSLALETSGFETDHEITAKVLARGLRIVEVPVTYKPRSKAEGKKIGLRDWFIGGQDDVALSERVESSADPVDLNLAVVEDRREITRRGRQDVGAPRIRRAARCRSTQR